MPITRLAQLLDAVQAKPRKRLAAAFANDAHTIEAVNHAVEQGIVDGTLVGDEAVIRSKCQELGIDPARVNVNGGAIALGHPLGCTGTKLTATILHEMQRTGTRYGMVSMCIGGGMGAAGIFEKV